jgi:hypothetical protein
MSPMSFLLRAGLVAALAAPAFGAPRPDPTDAGAAVPPLAYRSALADYRRLADTPPADWKAANQAVERIGGWRAYAREAQAGAASAPAAAPSVAPTPHRHH